MNLNNKTSIKTMTNIRGHKIYNDLADMNLDFHIFTDSSTRASAHAHWYLEMGYVEEGRANYCLNDDPSIIEEGNYYFIGHLATHSYMATSKSFKIINVMFNPVFFDDSLTGAKTLFEILGSKKINFDVNMFSVNPTTFIFKDHDGSIKKLLDDIIEEYTEKSTGYLEIIRCKLSEIIIKSLRPIYAQLPQTASATSDSFTKVIQYVNMHYMNDLTLSELCEISNYSVPHMSKKFKASFGISFSKYLMELRINASRRFLTNTGKTIDEIMDLVGYKDKKSFYNAFKAVSGTTPDAYRRKHKVI